MKVSALKHYRYWNYTLDDLKQESILVHNLWKSIGSLCRSGDSFNLIRDAKYKYKLAIRDASSHRFDDYLLYLVTLSKILINFESYGKITPRENLLVLTH